MKFIKKRNQYLKEAKLRDVILPKQAKEISDTWAEKFLDYEEVESTKNIKQGKWLLSEEDKLEVLGKFFECDMVLIFDMFSKIPEKFATTIAESIDLSLISKDKERYEKVLTNFNIKNPTIDQMIVLFDNIFRKLSINETKGSEMVQKGEDGRPLKDEEGKIVKISKEAGAPIFEKNLVNINSFVDVYNKCYATEKVDDSFNNRHLNSLVNMAGNRENNEYTVDFEVFNKDIYLSISHNPKDILNMSISKFYSSCQHLYSGGYKTQLLSNVFDPNSIPAFLIFETPIFWGNDKISDFLPLSRMMIRNIENFDTDKDPSIFFDRAYPDRMKDVFGKIVEKYSENVESYDGRGNYIFSPDIDLDDKLATPYMDRLGLDQVPFIGINTKTLNLNRSYDWSKVKISPTAKIKEIVIETSEIPENFFSINLTPDWIKFKFIKIKSVDNFKKIKTDSIGFDKCSMDNNTLTDLSVIFPDLKKLQLVTCDIKGGINGLSNFKNLEELQLIYTLDDFNELKLILDEINVKKVVISGDLLSSKDAKSYISSIKSKGTKIEIVGPVI